MKTRISKWGNSLGVRIPKAFASEAKIEAGTEVDISLADGKIVLTLPTAEYLLADLVAGLAPANRHGETDWGKPTGNEVW